MREAFNPCSRLASTDKPKVSSLVLFGSVARGTERPSSDIDLLVVVDKKEDKRGVTESILDLSVELASVLGNSLMPVVYSIQEASGKKGSPLFKNIEAEGRALYEKGGEGE